MVPRRSLLLVDLAFGDCGKGTVIDFLARTVEPDPVLVVRFNGGPQAGHNVFTPDGRHHTFSQFGSGSFVEGTRTLLSRFMLIEPYAMRRAILRLSRRDLDLAERLVNEMEAATAAGDRATLNEINYDFHFLFYNKVGNDGLTAEIRALWKQFPWDLLQVVEQRARQTSVEHRQILNAARAGDAQLIAQCTEEHLTRSFHGLAAHLTGADVPDPFDPDND